MISTLAELAGAGLIIAAALVTFGVGAAMLTAGVACIALGYLAGDA